ncbi:universal stress protein [Sphingobacterium rhinopitheci]|uniref:universal stress protein n=1 Tax=Sphingobacterium rhinopitheci TaxID=2781960 RepID=UPI001F527F3A|nr:universal stress protein [Sphingobacterium rhinopitheci]MCI0920213.1 universal stress protein [Sphingobacterium rhinopitheci]
MRNKILIPVDFTDHAQQAIDYACQLAVETAHDIDLIHVFTDHNNIYHNSLTNPDLIDPRVAFAKRDAEKIIIEYQEKFPSIQFNIIFKDGILFERLRETVTNNTYDAIIMGTKGASGLEAMLIGSNMFEVFQNTKVPVVAIPKSEKPFKTHKIGLLCNFKDGEIDVLKQAIKLYGIKFELTLIHINNSNDNISIIDKKFKTFIEKIISETGIDDISYVVKAQSFFIQYKEDISSAINSVITDEQLNLLLVTKSKKGFLRKVIEENVVKRMAYDIQIPKFFGKS